jgi:hypothetical protein
MNTRLTFKFTFWSIIALAIASRSSGATDLDQHNQCKDGYLTPKTRMLGLWKYNKANSSAPGLADVLVAQGRVYAVLNLRILITPREDWSIATNITFSFPTQDLSSTASNVTSGQRRLHANDSTFSAPGQLHYRDPFNFTVLIYTELPPFLANVTRETLWHVSISLNYKGETHVYSDAPFCVVPRSHQYPEKKWKLASCTSIVAHSSMQVPEWIAYHRMQGVEHFYIYIDSKGLTLVKMLLAPYVQAGVATIVDFHWPKEHMFKFDFQQSHLTSCFYRLKERAEWVAFHDVDEYFQPMNTTTVAQYLADRPDLAPRGAIRVKSWFFGHQQMLGAWQFSDGGYGGHSYDEVCSLLTNTQRYREEKAVPSGREKILVRPDVVFHVAVHMVTVGGENVDVDAEQELRVVHYKFGRTLESPVYDGSMSDYAPALRKEVAHWCVT